MAAANASKRLMDEPPGIPQRIDTTRLVLAPNPAKVNARFAYPWRIEVRLSPARSRAVTLPSTGGPQERRGARQLLAYVQSLNPSVSLSGADGVASTFPLTSTSWIASDAFRPAFAPFVCPRSKVTVESFGSGPTLTFPLLSITTGVSSIHSAVAWVEEY